MAKAANLEDPIAGGSSSHASHDPPMNPRKNLRQMLHLKAGHEAQDQHQILVSARESARPSTEKKEHIYRKPCFLQVIAIEDEV